MVKGEVVQIIGGGGSGGGASEASDGAVGGDEVQRCYQCCNVFNVENSRGGIVVVVMAVVLL